MELDEALAALEARRRAAMSFMSEAELDAQELARTSSPKMVAADNLLRKAYRNFVLRPEKAQAYVERAVALGFDEREECYPAAAGAHMLLFNLITDEIERSAEDEPEWLDVAVDVLASEEGDEQSELRSVLAEIAGLPGEYQLTALELSRVQLAITRVPEAPDLWDFAGSPDELRDRILAVLEVCWRFERLLDEEVGGA